MLSDIIFQVIDDLLEGIVNYEYSSEYKKQLIRIICKLNIIMDDLDHCSGMDYKIALLKDDNKKAMKIASNMYNNAIKKREMSSVDLYDNLFE